MTCADCGRSRAIMIVMAPGLDRKPWGLCSRCWRESVFKPRIDPITKPRPKKGEPAGVLPSTGEQMIYTGELIDLRTGERIEPGNP